MRSVVVFPQPDGPSSVANDPRGTSKEMSSTADTPPNIFVTFFSCRWMSGTGRSKRDASPREHREDAQRDDRETDVDDREGGRASPVQIVHQLEDADRRHGRARCEQE